MGKGKKFGAGWLLAGVLALLGLWWAQGRPLPVLSLPVAPQLLGIGGWALVGLGFFAVALTALLGPRGREHRPSLWPFRPQALFGLPVRHRKKH